MSQTTYEAYKYFMQDVSNIYVGAKYTLGEITENDDILFKFRKVVGESVLPHADRDDTLETHLYYLEDHTFLVQIYKQMHAQVRVSIIEERRGLFHKSGKKYVTRFIPIEEFVRIPISEKQEKGIVIQELKISKLALLTV